MFDFISFLSTFPLKFLGSGSSVKIKCLTFMPPKDLIQSSMYGLTECKRVSIMPYGMKEKKYKGSCGIPLPGVSVRLVNEHDGVGELEVIGPNVMEGYWNDSVETEKFYSVEEGERVLKTGDLFKIDEDGYLYFQGREKAFIKHNGYRINNLELEEIVASIDNVMENAVVGINDSDAGEDIVCVISLNDMTEPLYFFSFIP